MESLMSSINPMPPPPVYPFTEKEGDTYLEALIKLVKEINMFSEEL